MKKIRSFSLFLALFLLFSFTSCNEESGEITTEYISTIDTEVITQATETEEITEEETTAAGIDTDLIVLITTKPETTAEPEVTTVPEPETTAEPEVTTVPEPETTAEPEVTTIPEPETTAEPEVTTVPEPETTAEPEVTTVPEPETTAEPEEELNLAPDFTVYNKEGNPVRLSDMIGKPIVLNFWASWCGPCKMEMPDFEEAYREMGDDVVFMIVNLTDGTYETMASAQSFINSMGYTFPVYFDLTEDAAYTYGIVSIPTTYFIGVRGDLVAYAQGALDYETLLYGISMIHNEN